MKRFAPAVLIAAVALAACGEGVVEREDKTELETATTDGEAEALARALEAGDFADLQLGAKIVGPQGPEVKSTLATAEGNFADITSYVACPAGMDPCDPATAPAGTIYTYVHTVYPGEDNDPTTGAGTGNDSSDIEIAEAFKLLQPAHGFTGKVGYSKMEALAAVGETADVVITCSGGSIVWTINAVDKSNTWEQAEPITFYWQSTLPPAGPADVYALVANYTEARGTGPYPANAEGATNACSAPSTAGSTGG